MTELFFLLHWDGTLFFCIGVIPDDNHNSESALLSARTARGPGRQRAAFPLAGVGGRAKTGRAFRWQGCHQSQLEQLSRADFTANAGTVAAILSKDDLILSDELNHASIIDGCRLSRATIKVFKHRDVGDCERLCKETENWPGHKLLITDGVFSMDGDIAPLPALCDLAEKYNCIMMVDDAHSSGVLGRNGRGTIDLLGCHGRVHIQVGTLSKAIGSMGGYVCGSRELVDFLYRRARPFLYSTGHPPSVVATCQAAFTLLDSPVGEKLIKKLWSNTKFFQRRVKKLGFSIGASQTPITPIHVGEAAKAFEFSRRLFDAGVYAPPVGFPTVPEGKARLRAIVTATHRRGELERACEIIAEVGRSLGLV
jgi:glycine C-acetyltransferase